MSAEQHPATNTGRGIEPTPPTPAEREAAERADVAEDQRRQRDLDEAEMGGES